MNLHGRILFGLAVALLLSSTARAEIIYVYASQGDLISEAIDQAHNGDLIVLSPGVFSGPGNVNLSFQGKAIEIRGAGPGATIIDCQRAGQTRAFSFVNGEGNFSVLSNLTIRNGNASYSPVNSGGALLIGASPLIRNCSFENCRALVGGAIQVFRSGGVANPIIEDCTFIYDSSLVSSGGAIN